VGVDYGYADIEFYRGAYGGTFDGDDAVLSKALFEAGLKVDALTLNRARAGFSRLSDFQRELLKLACCYQADYIILNGEESAFSGAYSIGDLKVSGAVAGAAERSGCSRRAYELLAQSGLMARGA
jgi:hypothetical protein